MEHLTLAPALKLLDNVINVIVEIVAEIRADYPGPGLMIEIRNTIYCHLDVSSCASSHRRNAPIVASSGLSTTFMLITWTGVSLTESRELKHSRT